MTVKSASVCPAPFKCSATGGFSVLLCLVSKQWLLSPNAETYIKETRMDVECQIENLQNERCKDKLPYVERSVLKHLRQRTDITTKPADKGTAVVVLNKENFIAGSTVIVLTSGRRSLVSKHFNSAGHTLADFTVVAIDQLHSHDTCLCKIWESRWIRTLSTSHPFRMNLRMDFL